MAGRGTVEEAEVFRAQLVDHDVPAPSDADATTAHGTVKAPFVALIVTRRGRTLTLVRPMG